LTYNPLLLPYKVNIISLKSSITIPLKSPLNYSIPKSNSAIYYARLHIT
jgi:hypothetical protein